MLQTEEKAALVPSLESDCGFVPAFPMCVAWPQDRVDVQKLTAMPSSQLAHPGSGSRMPPPPDPLISVTVTSWAMQLAGTEPPEDNRGLLVQVLWLHVPEVAREPPGEGRSGRGWERDLKERVPNDSE